MSDNLSLSDRPKIIKKRLCRKPCACWCSWRCSGVALAFRASPEDAWTDYCGLTPHTSSSVWHQVSDILENSNPRIMGTVFLLFFSHTKSWQQPFYFLPKLVSEVHTGMLKQITIKNSNFSPIIYRCLTSTRRIVEQLPKLSRAGPLAGRAATARAGVHSARIRSKWAAMTLSCSAVV